MTQTRQRRMYLHWRTLRRRYDYRRGEGESVLMRLARHWRMPVRGVRAVLETERRKERN